jgi:microcystin-dependent protein
MISYTGPTGPTGRNLPYPDDDDAVYLGAAAFRAISDEHAGWWDQVITGMILMFGGTSDAPPAGWLWCDGSTVTRLQHPDLCTALAGSPTAATATLPDLRDRFPVGAESFSTGVGSPHPMPGSNSGSRATSGSPTISLANMPGHSHLSFFTFSSYGTVSRVRIGGGAHTHWLRAQSSEYNSKFFLQAGQGASSSALQRYCDVPVGNPKPDGCIDGGPLPPPSNTTRLGTWLDWEAGASHPGHVHDDHMHSVTYSVSIKVDQNPGGSSEFTPPYAAYRYMIKT